MSRFIYFFLIELLCASEKASHFVSTAEPLTAAPQLTPLPVVFAEGGSGE